MNTRCRSLQILVLATVLSLGQAAWADTPRPADQAGLKAAQARDGQNRRVRIHNQTGRAWVQLQVSPSAAGDWTGDRLAGRGLPAGGSVVVNFDAGSDACVHDLRAELEGGPALIRQGVNVCAIADYYFTR